MDIYKESVELTFVYLLEGCGKTLSKIDDTIPHTRIDMGYRGTQNVPVHRDLYEVSVARIALWSRKLPHFQSRTSEKHFHKYVMPDGAAK